MIMGCSKLPPSSFQFLEGIIPSIPFWRNSVFNSPFLRLFEISLGHGELTNNNRLMLQAYTHVRWQEWGPMQRIFIWCSVKLRYDTIRKFPYIDFPNLQYVYYGYCSYE